MNKLFGYFIKVVAVVMLSFFSLNVIALNQWKSSNYYMAGFLVVIQEDSQWVKYRAIRPSKNKIPFKYESYWQKIEVKINANTETVIPLSPEAIDTSSEIGVITVDEVDVIPDISVEVDTQPEIDTAESGLLRGSGEVPGLFQEEDSSNFGLPSFDEVTTESLASTDIYNENISWDKKNSYIKGDIVSFNDNLYKARWSNINNIPGVTEAWIISREDGKFYFWEKDHIYPLPGFEVIYSGKVYKNIRWTLGERPLAQESSSNTEEYAWVFVSNSNQVKGEPWLANIRYAWTSDKPSVVSYGGYLYRNRWVTIGEIPGRTEAWTLVVESNKKYYWDIEHIYPVPGIEVIFGDALYVNTGWTKGDIPGKDLAIWSKLKDLDSLWNQNIYYEKGTVIRFNGYLYKSLWGAAGQVPGQSETWVLSDDSGKVYPWQNDHTYVLAGAKVVYKTKYYINKARSRNDIPGISGVWELLIKNIGPYPDDPVDPDDPVNPVNPVDPVNPVSTTNCSQPNWVSSTNYIVGNIVIAECRSFIPGTPCYDKSGVYSFKCIEIEGTTHCDYIHPGENSYNIWELVEKCS